MKAMKIALNILNEYYVRLFSSPPFSLRQSHTNPNYVFEMHACDDTRSDLEDIITLIDNVVFWHLHDLKDHVKDIADEGLWDATKMQWISSSRKSMQ